MTYEQFSETVCHESHAHFSALLPYAEISFSICRNRYIVYCPVTDAECKDPHVAAEFEYYDAAERDLYARAIANNLL